MLGFIKSLRDGTNSHNMKDSPQIIMTSIIFNKYSPESERIQLLATEMDSHKRLNEDMITTIIVSNRYNSSDDKIKSEIKILNENTYNLSNFRDNTLHLDNLLLMTTDCRVSDFEVKTHSYLYRDKDTDICYGMSLDNYPSNLQVLLNNANFYKWFNAITVSPEPVTRDDKSLLFYWLVYNIISTGNDTFIGLYNGLKALSNLKIGGLFNLMFTDGNCIFALTFKSDMNRAYDSISYKLICRNENSYNYVLRNYNEEDDFEWIKTKSNCLYYFPLKSQSRNFIDLETHNSSDILVNKCISWVCII